MQRSALCRSRRELSNEYLLAKFGFDTAENELLEVWGENSIQYSFASLGPAPRNFPIPLYFISPSSPPHSTIGERFLASIFFYFSGFHETGIPAVTQPRRRGVSLLLSSPRLPSQSVTQPSAPPNGCSSVEESPSESSCRSDSQAVRALCFHNALFRILFRFLSFDFCFFWVVFSFFLEQTFFCWFPVLLVTSTE